MSSEPRTLAVDVGGTGIKASVLDARGNMDGERVRVPTTYPMPPAKMVEIIGELAAKLPPVQRVSIGFPGVVREGRVVTAPHFVTKKGPGTKVSKSLQRQWSGFALAEEVSKALSAPVKLANDADLQGSDVISGDGLELVVTLGTGVGTGLFYNGTLAPHLELAHHPFLKGLTYNEAIGEAARRRLGNRRWNKRVQLALRTLHDLVLYDHLYIGGGNSRRINFEVGADTSIVDNSAGLLGGIKLWETAELGTGTGAGPAPAPAKRAPRRRSPSGRTAPPPTG
jgi:polyphosphate glucokinase